MANSNSEVYLRFTWLTKERYPFFEDSKLKAEIFNHILYNAKLKGIVIEALNGYHDHVHCLIRMHREIALGKMIQLIKGESSYWINKNLNLPATFQWQDGYYVNAVPVYEMEKIKNYILNQDEHHSLKDGIEEKSANHSSDQSGNS